MSGTMADNDPRHGTYAGVMRHTYTKTPRCEPCALAAKLHIREWRSRRASMIRYPFPVALTLAAYDFEGVGITIARAIRESA